MFQKTIPYENVVSEAVRNLLEPLQSLFPETIPAVYQALNDGRSPNKAGAALQACLKAWTETVKAQAAQDRLPLHDEIRELKNSIYERDRQSSEIQRKMNELVKEGEAQKLIITGLQKTIENQNSIIAEQHKRLISLLGRTNT